MRQGHVVHRWVAGVAGLGVCAGVLWALSVMAGVGRAIEPQDGDAASSVAALQPQRVASVDMLILVERVALLPVYADAMATLTAERSKELQAIVDEQAELEKQAQALDQTGEQFKALQSRYMTLDQTFKTRQKEVQAEVEKLTATQVQQAYGQVLAAVQAFAKERGYSHVLASRDAGAAFRAPDFANTLQEVLARSVVVSPREDDLTEPLMDVLGVRGIDPMVK
jgi:Skp family chaperone for outer membrane proteins